MIRWPPSWPSGVRLSRARITPSGVVIPHPFRWAFRSRWQGTSAKPSDGLEPTTPSLPWQSVRTPEGWVSSRIPCKTRGTRLRSRPQRREPIGTLRYPPGTRALGGRRTVSMRAAPPRGRPRRAALPLPPGRQSRPRHRVATASDRRTPRFTRERSQVRNPPRPFADGSAHRRFSGLLGGRRMRTR
jgi:hypothetical protein